MKVLTVHDKQYQQSFQMGKLKLGHTIIPGKQLGEVEVYSEMTSRRKTVFIVALLQRSGQVLRKFGRYTFNEATNIHAKLLEAIRLTQEAPEGKVVDFFKIDDKKISLRKPPRRATNKHAQDRLFPLRSIKSEVVASPADAGEPGGRIIVYSNVKYVPEPIWSWEEGNFNTAHAIAHRLGFEISRAKKLALKGGPRHINLDKIARALSENGRGRTLPEESLTTLRVVNV